MNLHSRKHFFTKGRNRIRYLAVLPILGFGWLSSIAGNSFSQKFDLFFWTVIGPCGVLFIPFVSFSSRVLSFIESLFLFVFFPFLIGLIVSKTKFRSLMNLLMGIGWGMSGFLNAIGLAYENKPSFKNEPPNEDNLFISAEIAPVANDISDLAVSVTNWSQIMGAKKFAVQTNPIVEAAEKNAAANELFSLPELPDGVVSDLSRMFASADEDEVWRDYCLQFLGSALEREDGVTDEDRALARETLVEALSSTNATFTGTALRALHRGDPSDPLVASNALRTAPAPSN